MTVEPYYCTHPVSSGGANTDYIILDHTWDIDAGSLIYIEVRKRGSDQPFCTTKRIGMKGNSKIVYIPKIWNLKPGDMCFVKVTPLDENGREVEFDNS